MPRTHAATRWGKHKIGDDLSSMSFFLDTQFVLRDDGDPTKEAWFQCASISANTRRQLTIQDQDGTIALLSDIPSVLTDHGALTGLLDDDHTQYAPLAGRGSAALIFTHLANTNGVMRVNALAGTAAGVDIFSVERAGTQWFRTEGDGQSYFASSTTSGIVNIGAVAGGVALAVGTSGTTTVINHLLGSADYNHRIIGTGAVTWRHNTAGNSLQGTWDGSFLFQPPTATTTTVPVNIRRRVSQTGNLLNFQSEAPATLSYFDKDGSYNGPAVFTTASVIDNAFNILDNLDPTKIAQFQVASLAAGTNVFTFPATAAGTFAMVNLAQTFTKTQTFQPDTNGDVAMVAKEKAGSTANLWELRDSAGALHMSLDRATFGVPLFIINAADTGAVPFIRTTTSLGGIAWGLLGEDLGGVNYMILTLGGSISGNPILEFPAAGGTVTTATVAIFEAANTVYMRTSALMLGQFRDTTDTTKRFRIINNSQQTNTTFTITSAITASQTYTFPDVTGKAVVRVGEVNLTAQTASIGSTNLVASAIAGLWLIDTYLACTTAEAGTGTVTTTIGWTDVNGAQSETVASRVLTSTGKTNDTRLIQVNSVSNITYSTTYTPTAGGVTEAYALYIRATLI